MKLSLGAALLAAIALAASACGTSHPITPPRTVHSSGFMLDGAVRCTATITTPAEAGRGLDVVFRFHNVSKRTVKVDLVYGGMWILVKSPDGTRYDSRVPFEALSGPDIPIPIAPGETKTEPLGYLAVHWEGPLRITPGCGLTTLRPVRVVVTSPGVPVSDSAAVRDIVAASGHLLDHCRPRTPGVSVVGQIYPPSGNAPPMDARCSVSLRREQGFDVAQVLILTPPNLQGVHVDRTYEALTGINRRNSNTEAIGWRFVVTRNGATPVDSVEADTSRSGPGMAPHWNWTGSKWEGPGGSHCGDVESGTGITFISVCGR